MLNCSEVTRAISQEDVARAEWKKRLAIRLHLLMCRHCRRYAEQLRVLGAAARRTFRDRDQDQEALQRLEQSILEGVSVSEESSENGEH